MAEPREPSEPSALERLAVLEAERDALRDRLASFERGDHDVAHRAELQRLEAEAEQLRAENEELRRRIGASRRRTRSPLAGLTRLIEDLLERFIKRGT
jgi:chromosome segregation ATPase